MWVIIGLSVALSTVILYRYRTRRSSSPPELGWVTERWLAEHRAHQSGESG
jgi:hypothetical protein